MSHIVHPNTKKDGLKFPFVKYHGNGNDFIIFDSFATVKTPFEPWIIENASRLCDRHRGIGADGIILLQKKNCHFFMIVVNADGTVAENCGNGLRCAAAHIFKTLSINSSEISLRNHIYQCEKKDFGIAVDMGDCQITTQDDLYLSCCKQTVQIALGSMGNKHLMCFLKEPVKDFTAAINELRSLITIDSDVNIGFIFKESANRYFSIVHERGVGFTKSCGSGACAAASFIKVLFEQEKNTITMVQPGGEIEIDAQQKVVFNKSMSFKIVQMGQAEEVFAGICEVSETW